MDEIEEGTWGVRSKEEATEDKQDHCIEDMEMLLDKLKEDYDHKIE